MHSKCQIMIQMRLFWIKITNTKPHIDFTRWYTKSTFTLNLSKVHGSGYGKSLNTEVCSSSSGTLILNPTYSKLKKKFGCNIITFVSNILSWVHAVIWRSRDFTETFGMNRRSKIESITSSINDTLQDYISTSTDLFAWNIFRSIPTSISHSHIFLS